MSLDEFWGYRIDGRTTVQESPTALIIDSNPGYVFRYTPMSKWIWVQEGSLLRCSYGQGVSLRDACWAATGFWGVWPPFFVVPSFMFKLTFLVVLLRSFGQSLMRWSGLLHLKQFPVFFWYNLIALAKQMIYPTHLSALPTVLGVSTSSPAEDSVSPSPSCFAQEFYSTSLLPMVSAWVMKVWLPFNLHKGKRFCEVWECVTFNTLVMAVFGGSGSLASVPLSSFLVARSRSE